MASDRSNLQNFHRGIFLASASPRRQDLLRQIGVRFQLLNHQVDEQILSGELPRDFVTRMAREKAISGLQQVPQDYQPVVLGADTIVVIDSNILGKPRDRRDALSMLQRLSGREHFVLTAVTVTNASETQSVISETAVSVGPITKDQAQAYWETGEPADKAGAYAVQGLGSIFIKAIKGSYSGVVGLPIFETSRLLTHFGVKCWQPNDQGLEIHQ